MKCDCTNGSFVNGILEPISFSFGLDKPIGQKIYKEPRIKLFENVNRPITSHNTFYLEEGDHIAVDFNGETISFSCQLTKI